MATTNNLTEFLTGVADAIRAKKSTTALINPQDFATEIASISGGGGGDEPQPEGTHKVLFVDVDGTVLKTEYVADGGSATPPAKPTRTYCTFVEWVGDYTNVTDDIAILPQYKSSDGLCHYELRVYAGDTISFSVYVASTLNIDWGDGETTYYSSAGSKTPSHTYAKAGTYWVSHTMSGNDTFAMRSAYPARAVIGYIHNGGTKSITTAIRYCINCKYAVFSPGLTTVKDEAADYCTKLPILVLPEGVTTIGKPYRWCYGIKYMYLPTTLTSLSSQAFRYCYSLKYLIIKANLTALGQQTFDQCVSLERLDLPETLATLDAQVFSNCYSLKALTLPATLTSAQKEDFSGCLSLRELNIPESLTSIPPNMFSSCFSLRKLTLPSTLTSIGATAFSSANSIQVIVCKAATPPTLSNASWSTTSLQALYVPDDSVDSYKAATNWSAYASKILPLSEYTE